MGGHRSGIDMYKEDEWDDEHLVRAAEEEEALHTEIEPEAEPVDDFPAYENPAGLIDAVLHGHPGEVAAMLEKTGYNGVNQPDTDGCVAVPPRVRHLVQAQSRVRLHALSSWLGALVRRVTDSRVFLSHRTRTRGRYRGAPIPRPLPPCSVTCSVAIDR